MAVSDYLEHANKAPTMAEVAAERKQKGEPIAKPLPTPLRKEEKKKTKAAKEKDFRLGVWERDKGRSRASGKPLARSGSDWNKVGEVHHVIARSLAPERIYDVSNGILLSKQEHALAETNCPNDPSKRLLDISGPEDRALPQTFIWRDIDGKELRRTVG